MLEMYVNEAAWTNSAKQDSHFCGNKLQGFPCWSSDRLKISLRVTLMECSSHTVKPRSSKASKSSLSISFRLFCSLFL